MKSNLIKHKDCGRKQLEHILNIKAFNWPFSLEDQLKWINKNIDLEDYHLLITDDNDNVIAYADFVHIHVFVNSKIFSFMGIGNVCTIKKGAGYGKIVMRMINQQLKVNNWKGILLCRDELVNYYKKFDWISIEREYVSPSLTGNIFVYNFPSIIKKLSYKGKKF